MGCCLFFTFELFAQCIYKIRGCYVGPVPSILNLHNDTFDLQVTPCDYIAIFFIPDSCLLNYGGITDKYGNPRDDLMVYYVPGTPPPPPYDSLREGYYILYRKDSNYTNDGDTVVFILNLFTRYNNLTVRSNPPNGGTTSVTDTIVFCSLPIDIIAIPNSGFRFVNWTNRSGQQISTTNPLNVEYAYPTDRDTIIIANFEVIGTPPQTYTLTVEATTDGATTPSGTSTQDSGTVVELRATADNCYKFVNWTNRNGVQVSNANPLNVTMVRDTLLVANFAKDSFNLTLQASSGGNVTPSDTTKYVCDTSIQIRAFADNCYKFVNWSDGNTASIRTIKMDRNISLVAVFALDSFDLVVTSDGNGDVEPSGTNRRACNAEARITATANNCYVFKHWTDRNNNIISTENPLLVRVSSDTTLVAVFEIKQFDLTIDKNLDNGGNVSGARTYNCGEVATVRATANDCYIFRYWSANGTIISTSNPLSVTISSDTTLTANFEKVAQFEVILFTDPPAGGVVSGGGHFDCPGETITINAVANAGFEFVNWTHTQTGVQFSDKPSETFFVDKSYNLTANFKIEETIGTKYLVELRSDPMAAGILTGGGYYDFDEQVSITATATNAGSSFVNWQDTFGIEISKDPDFTLFVKCDTVLIANFVPKIYEVILYSNPAGAILTGANTYDSNSIATISASFADDCYEFKHWADRNNNIVSTENPFTITITSDTVLVAIYELQKFTLTLDKIPQEAGTVSGANTYDCGEVVKIVAEENDCYEFKYWFDKNNNIISTENPLLVTISSDTLLVANFEYTCDTTEPEKYKFYIRASTHQQLNPRWMNYPIPIYIKAEENISGAIIEQLVIEIDRTLFNPHRVGYLTSKDNGFMIFENIPVPNLIANEEQLLFNIWGDIMLGNKDSSGILVNSAKFSDDLDVDLEFIAGYLTIEICRAGGDRLLRWFDYVPAVLVKNNPVTSEILEVECRTSEIGNYSLEVIDLLGHTKIIKEWEVTEDTIDSIFDFDILIDNYTSGSYILIMHTPTTRYITKFVVNK